MIFSGPGGAGSLPPMSIWPRLIGDENKAESKGGLPIVKFGDQTAWESKVDAWCWGSYSVSQGKAFSSSIFIGPRAERPAP